MKLDGETLHQLHGQLEMLAARDMMLIFEAVRLAAAQVDNEDERKASLRELVQVAWPDDHLKLAMYWDALTRN